MTEGEEGQRIKTFCNEILHDSLRLAMADQQRSKSRIKHDAYDEAVDAEDAEDDFDADLSVEDAIDSRLTLESVRPSAIHVGGAGGVTGAGAGALFDDTLTLESCQPGTYVYERKPLNEEAYRSASEVELGNRPSDDSTARESLFQGHTGIAPADWRLNSQPDLEPDSDEDGDHSPPDSDEEGLRYNPVLYAGLPVKPLIKDLFPMITEYEPRPIRMDYKLVPFIPEMIPAIGDIDAFIKIPRPDKKQDPMGLGVLDEPSCGQTDPQLHDLKLRALAKGATTAAMVDVKTLPEIEGNAINEWMDNVDSLHREKPPAKVYYSNPMPDIDQLMQAWPPEMEKRLNDHPPKLPKSKTLEEAVDVACNILDIPVHKEEKNGRIQALHQMMTLYLEFKRSQHFGSKING